MSLRPESPWHTVALAATAIGTRLAFGTSPGIRAQVDAQALRMVRLEKTVSRLEGKVDTILHLIAERRPKEPAGHGHP